MQPIEPIPDRLRLPRAMHLLEPLHRPLGVVTTDAPAPPVSIGTGLSFTFPPPASPAAAITGDHRKSPAATPPRRLPWTLRRKHRPASATAAPSPGKRRRCQCDPHCTDMVTTPPPLLP